MGWVADLGQWLAANWTDLGNLVFAGVVAWTAWVTTRLSRRLAEAELDPAITVFIEGSRENFGLFDVVIKNLGRGAARNVRFRVEPDIPIEKDDEESRLTQLAAIDKGLDYMAPLQEIRSFYGSMPGITEQVITIHVCYERDSDERRLRRLSASFSLDIGRFKGITRVG